MSILYVFVTGEGSVQYLPEPELPLKVKKKTNTYIYMGLLI